MPATHPNFTTPYGYIAHTHTEEGGRGSVEMSKFGEWFSLPCRELG